jgi:hypothetical protein
MSFDDPRRPVLLASDLEGLDSAEILEGYQDAHEGFPCSGNRSRAYWHGWQNGMVDTGKMGKTVYMELLARDVVGKQRDSRADEMWYSR